MSQPGIVTSGLVGEYHAARADAGLTHGYSGLTTWANTAAAGDGTLTGFTGSPWVGSGTPADPFALDFSGASTRYVAAKDFSAVEDKTCTYEAWVKTSVAAIQYLFQEYQSTTNCQLRTNSLGALACSMTPDGGSPSTITGVSISDGNWHHVAVVLDGANRTLYCDGALGTPASIPAGTYTVNTSRIGHSSSSWQGSIACVRVYSGALSLAELQQNRAAGMAWPQAFNPGSERIPAARHYLHIGDTIVPVKA